MPLEIVHYPHPVLRHVSKPIRRVDNQLRAWVAEMIDLMYEHEGVGLAANQVALPYRLFVMNPTGDSQQPEEERVIINPVLSRAKGTQVREEGCLSLPGVHADVIRSKSIHLEGYDLEGNEISVDLVDFPARVVQHETDHLDGRLFIDRLAPSVQATLRDLVAEFEIDYESRLETGEAPGDADVMAAIDRLESERT